MRILFYIGANNGDLINFTGILNFLKVFYPTYQFDFLIPRAQAYILNYHPGVNKILFLEDFPSLPNHVLMEYFDSSIKKAFLSSYDRVLGIWGCLTKSPDTNDFVDMMLNLMWEYEFKLPVKRQDVNGVFYYTTNDYVHVDNFYNSLPKGKRILIEEHAAKTWIPPQQ